VAGEEGQALAGCRSQMCQQITSVRLEDGDDSSSFGRIAAITQVTSLVRYKTSGTAGDDTQGVGVEDAHLGMQG